MIYVKKIYIFLDYDGMNEHYSLLSYHSIFQVGIKRAFSSGEFRNIASGPLRLSSVSHVASIDVTVDGTVGAAATGQLLL